MTKQQPNSFYIIQGAEKTFQVSNSRKNVKLDGTVITLDLTKQNVPADATEVIIYAYVRSGNMGSDVDGSLDITSNTGTGLITKSVFFHTFYQSAWSFNSEHISLPIGASHTVTAKVKTTATGSNFLAAVQVVGYKAHC